MLYPQIHPQRQILPGSTWTGYGHKSFRISGERGQNRTVNLLIKSQLLCQLSYASTIKPRWATTIDYHVDYWIWGVCGKFLAAI